MKRPNDHRLRGASLMDIGRTPGSPAATAFVSKVWPHVAPHMARNRMAGPVTVARDVSNLGVILGGIMRPGIVGAPVRVPRAKMSGMWDAPVIGYQRVWNMLDALKAAGFIGLEPGVKSQRGLLPGEFIQEGLATCIWPADTLDELAAECGMSAETRKADWTVDSSLLAKPDTTRDLIVCRHLKLDKASVPLAPDTGSKEAEAMRANLAAINALLGSTAIRGAGTIIGLRRSFRHSLRLHGRHYTGHGTLQQASREERLRITFDGEFCAEVDVKASQLTVALGLAQHGLGPVGKLPRRDLYRVNGIPRDIVKAWMVRTMGNGRATWKHWGDKPPPGSDQFKPAVVWAAVKPLYPFLEDLSTLVPSDLLATLPGDCHHWAGGQFVVGQEARIMAAAMSYCVQRSVPVLPVHDSLVVAVSKVKVAEEALTGAFMALGGVVPHLEIDYPPGYVRQKAA